MSQTVQISIYALIKSLLHVIMTKMVSNSQVINTFLRLSCSITIRIQCSNFDHN